MNVYATAALNNAKTRLQIGWPLLLLALSLYAPADGVTRLVLFAVGAALVVRAVPAPPAKRSPKKSPTTSVQPRPELRKTTSSTSRSAKAPGKVPTQRGKGGPR